MSDKYVLAIDVREYRVELWKERWNHLVRKHPDLIKYEITPDDLKEAIENPRHGCIYSSHVFPEDCAIYYIRYNKRLELVVVVRYANDVGEIVSAHFCSKRPEGEVMIWPITSQ